MISVIWRRISSPSLTEIIAKLLSCMLIQVGFHVIPMLKNLSWPFVPFASRYSRSLWQKTLLYVEGLGRQLYPQLDLWTTAKPFLESWVKDQVGLPAMLRALKEKAPFWIEKMPELPDLVYQRLNQHKLLQYNIEKLSTQIQHQGVRQGQSRYLFGIGATLLLSGTILLLGQVEVYPAWLMAAGVVFWLIGWKRSS